MPGTPFDIDLPLGSLSTSAPRRAAAGPAPLGVAAVQSVLEPHGTGAERIASLAWTMFAGGAAIFVAVMLLAALAIWVRPRWLARPGTIVAGGVIFPVLALTALLVYGLHLGGALARSGEPAALRIRVIGEQYWWRVHYLDASGKAVLASANEIRIPAGRPVELLLETRDVIHSFWVPSLAGKLDMIPGRTNRLRLHAQRPGIYRGQCAEYCGTQHAFMALYLVAAEEAELAAWLAHQRQPAARPSDPLREQGLALFLAWDCGKCHTIRGTAAAGDTGPDLTHVGSRLSIGAGMFPNNVGTLAGWIASSQHLKPGNAMPSFDRLTGVQLRALAAYLEGLE